MVAILKTPTVTTQSPGDNSTKVASTAYADAAVAVEAALRIPLSYLDTDGTLAANSDTKVASQKATKTYVDNVAAGLDIKPSVLAATTAQITLSGTQTVDGIALQVGDRCLVRAQTLPKENGIYVVASGAWTRATDMDSWTEVPGASVWVETGTTLADTAWVCTADAGGTLGTTSITWSQWAGSGLYAPINSPTFTGTPAAPTPSAGDNTTKLATTAFVATSFAPLASPALTGTPTAPTPSAADNSTKIATTAYVDGAIAAIGNITEAYSEQGSNQTGGNDTTARDAVNGVTAPTLGVGTYEFELDFWYTLATSTVDHNTNLTLAGTATWTVMRCLHTTQPPGTSSGTASLSSGNLRSLNGPTSITIGARTGAASIVDNAGGGSVRGVLKVTGLGTVKFQFAFTAGPGSAPTILAGNFFRARKIA